MDKSEQPALGSPLLAHSLALDEFNKMVDRLGRVGWWFQALAGLDG
ncbi:MAG: hypothetical protein GTO29_11745 [Candidatus Latescibacteria bacterium]|nr:hypothetical protein [Candidatus Latescibacterota bacterium]NIO56839.1 hypothetical protein [Candidatus Latescibacterota bacterium]